MFIYYVYAYVRKSNGLPYYIGKGKDKRAYKKHGRISVPQDKSKIVFLESNLSNIGACALERRYIRWYGKKIDGGILLNITDGGDGTPGGKSRKGQINTKEHRKKISKTNTGQKRSETTRKNIAKANIGRKHSKKTKEKMRISRFKNLLKLNPLYENAILSL
jgi:hypothetical protein